MVVVGGNQQIVVGVVVVGKLYCYVVGVFFIVGDVFVELYVVLFLVIQYFLLQFCLGDWVGVVVGVFDQWGEIELGYVFVVVEIMICYLVQWFVEGFYDVVYVEVGYVFYVVGLYGNCCVDWFDFFYCFIDVVVDF